MSAVGFAVVAAGILLPVMIGDLAPDRKRLAAVDGACG